MGERDIMSGKAAVTGDIGEKIDAQLVAAERNAHKAEGGHVVLTQHVDVLGAIFDIIDKERDGEIDLARQPCPFPGEGASALEIAAYAKHQVIRAQESIRAAALKQKHLMFAEAGKVNALRPIVDLVQNQHTVATRRVEQLIAQETAAKDSASQDGVLVTEEAVREHRKSNRGGHPGMRPSVARALEDAEASEDASTGPAPKKPKLVRKPRKAKALR